MCVFPFASEGDVSFTSRSCTASHLSRRRKAAEGAVLEMLEMCLAPVTYSLLHVWSLNITSGIWYGDIQNLRWTRGHLSAFTASTNWHLENGLTVCYSWLAATEAVFLHFLQTCYLRFLCWHLKTQILWELAFWWLYDSRVCTDRNPLFCWTFRLYTSIGGHKTSVAKTFVWQI